MKTLCVKPSCPTEKRRPLVVGAIQCTPGPAVQPSQKLEVGQDHERISRWTCLPRLCPEDSQRDRQKTGSQNAEPETLLRRGLAVRRASGSVGVNAAEAEGDGLVGGPRARQTCDARSWADDGQDTDNRDDEADQDRNEGEACAALRPAAERRKDERVGREVEIWSMPGGQREVSEEGSRSRRQRGDTDSRCRRGRRRGGRGEGRWARA